MIYCGSPKHCSETSFWESVQRDGPRINIFITFHWSLLKNYFQEIDWTNYNDFCCFSVVFVHAAAFFFMPSPDPIITMFPAHLLPIVSRLFIPHHRFEEDSRLFVCSAGVSAGNEKLCPLGPEKFSPFLKNHSSTPVHSTTQEVSPRDNSFTFSYLRGPFNKEGRVLCQIHLSNVLLTITCVWHLSINSREVRKVPSLLFCLLHFQENVC